MSDKEVKDELAEKTIQSAKYVKTIPDEDPTKDVWVKIAKALANKSYVVTNEPEALRELGVSDSDIKKIKRPRGRSRKTLYKDQHIVQLIYKQNLQAGVPFTNVAGKEMNLCFIAVAEHQNVGVDQIVKKYCNVSPEERKEIKEWVRKELSEHGLLYNNNQE
jgi:hypothetical protein